MEFHYITMYCFAPAAQALPSSSRTAANALSEFSDQAAQASYSLLAVIVDVLEPGKLIAYLPVRCWLFIVAASLHLLKVCRLEREQNHGLRFNRPLLPKSSTFRSRIQTSICFDPSSTPSVKAPQMIPTWPCASPNFSESCSRPRCHLLEALHLREPSKALK